MDVYVYSRGWSLDYDWNCLPSEAILDSHRINPVKGMARDFLFSASYVDSGWNVVLHNLCIPGRKDNLRREIAMYICFCGLQSEAEVRSLALAFLSSEWEKEENEYRCNVSLTAGHSFKEDGSFCYDPDVATRWAEQAIREYHVIDKSSVKPKVAEIDPLREDEQQKLCRYLETNALRCENGLRLLCTNRVLSKCDIPNPPPDLIVQCSSGPDKWEDIEPFPPKEETPGSICQNPKQSIIGKVMNAVNISLVLIFVLILYLMADRIEPDKSARSETMLSPKIEIVSSPAGAEVLCNGVLLGKTPCFVRVQREINELFFRKEGYITVRDNLSLHSGRRVDVQLVTTEEGESGIQSAALAEVEILSVPEGAQTLYNGVYIGDTPCKVRVMMNPGTLTIKAAGYEKWESSIDPESGGRISAELKPLSET